MDTTAAAKWGRPPPAPNASRPPSGPWTRRWGSCPPCSPPSTCSGGCAGCPGRSGSSCTTSTTTSTSPTSSSATHAELGSRSSFAGLSQTLNPPSWHFCFTPVCLRVYTQPGTLGWVGRAKAADPSLDPLITLPGLDWDGHMGGVTNRKEKKEIGPHNAPQICTACCPELAGWLWGRTVAVCTDRHPPRTLWVHPQPQSLC